jgi:hypothetical protein
MRPLQIPLSSRAYPPAKEYRPGFGHRTGARGFAALTVTVMLAGLVAHFIGSSVHAMGPVGSATLERLVTRAHELALADQREWHLLLH